MYFTVKCPYCDSYDTVSDVSEAELSQMSRASLEIDVSWGNPDRYRLFRSGFPAVCRTCKSLFDYSETLVRKPASERLEVLERMRLMRIVTDEDYERRRREIERDL